MDDVQQCMLSQAGERTAVRPSCARVRAHPIRGRVRVEIQDEWQLVGRRYFLTRDTYKAAVGWGIRHRTNDNQVDSNWSIMMEILVGLAILLTPFYLLRKATQWVFGDLYETAESCLLKLGRAIRRWFVATTWSKPVQRFGIAKTLWLWAVSFTALATVFAIVKWQLHELLGLIVMWGILAGSWWVLRYWGQHRYRPRVLPARRPRR